MPKTGLIAALAAFSCACGGTTDEAAVGADESALGTQQLLFEKTNWGRVGEAYDTSFFNKADADTPVKGTRGVKWSAAVGSYQEQTITESHGWGDLSLHRAQLAASEGQWWKNVIHGRTAQDATIYVEGKIYFVDANAHVLYECVSVVTSHSWTTGELEVWNVAKGIVPEVNTEESACKAPKGTKELWMHIKTTAKKAGQTGTGMVSAWRVGRCANSGHCDLR